MKSMKNKNNFIKKLISYYLLITLIVTSESVIIAANAEESIEINNIISYNETDQSDASFASKNLITGEETFYNLYNNGTIIDLSEDDEFNEMNSDITEKSDSPYFPEHTTEITSAEDGTIIPFSLIGGDDRNHITNTTTYPYSAVCYIISYWPNGTASEGTAWMYWEDIAITAGHCVYSKDDGGWAEKIEVIPAANGYYSPYGAVNSVTMHTSTKWIEDSNWEYDYGVLELSRDIGNYTGWFGISYTIWSLKGTDVTITGYPGEYHRQMWTMDGEITKSSTRKIYYNAIDTTSGQSGSPIYDDDKYVVGIHAYGEGSYGNSGTRITSSMYDFFHSFRE